MVSALSIHCDRGPDGTWNWHFLGSTGRYLVSGEGGFPDQLTAVKAGRVQRDKFLTNQAEVDHCRK